MLIYILIALLLVTNVTIGKIIKQLSIAKEMTTCIDKKGL